MKRRPTPRSSPDAISCASAVWGCVADGSGPPCRHWVSASASPPSWACWASLSRPSRGLLAELGPRLGNLLTVQAGSTAFNQQTELSSTAESMVARVGPVTHVTEIASIQNTYVYRNSFIPVIDTNGIALTATDSALPATLGASLAQGTFLNAATAHFPAVVLGAEAATLLGIHDLSNPTQVWIGLGHRFTVVGILKPVEPGQPDRQHGPDRVPGRPAVLRL